MTESGEHCVLQATTWLGASVLDGTTSSTITGAVLVSVGIERLALPKACDADTVLSVMVVGLSSTSGVVIVSYVSCVVGRIVVVCCATSGVEEESDGEKYW